MPTPPTADGRRALRAAVVLMLAFASGCPKPGVEPTEPRGPALTADQVVAAALARRSAVTSVRARVESEVRFGSFEQDVDMAMLLERPDRMRAEALGLFGPVMMVALDGHQLTAFDAMRDRYLSGRYPEGAEAAELPLPPLASDEMIDLLLGTPIDEERAASLEPLEAESAQHLRFAWQDDEGHGEIVFRSRLGVPVRFVSAPGRTSPGYEVRWSWKDDAEVPRRVQIDFAGDAASLVVHWGDAEIDPELADDLFTLPLPAGVERIDLDALSRRGAHAR